MQNITENVSKYIEDTDTKGLIDLEGMIENIS
jgi:hypothetical protein